MAAAKADSAKTGSAAIAPTSVSQRRNKPAAPAIKPVATKPASTKKAAPERAAAVKTAATATRAAPATRKENTMATTIDNTTNKAQAMFNDATTRAKDAAEKGQKVVGDMTDFGKGNIEAMVESSKIAARGMESMAQDAVAFARTSFEEASAAAKTLASAKSPTEFVKLQSDFARTSFDAMVAHNSRSTEAMLKLVGEVVQPLSNRFALAADKVKAAA